MKKNVLIFPCGSEFGLEAHRALRYSTHFNLIGASSVDDHGKFVFDNYVGDIPFVNTPGFLERVNEVVDSYNIDFIIPAHDNVLLSLAQEKAAGRLHCELITSPLETCEIATSKLKTYEFFKDILPTPKVFKSISEVRETDLPIFLKPEVGNGSRGTQTAKTLEDITFYTKKDPSLLLLEFLPGKEFTVDCFTNHKGELLFCKARQRARIGNGISTNSVHVADNRRFREIAELINKHLPWRGVWFFQVKENAKGELVLMEIAPRAAGTSGLARGKGVNLLLLSLFDAQSYDVDVFENDYDIVIDRALQNRYRHNIAYQHVYLDFDDLVIFDGKVNPEVMAFVYQCFNKKIKVHLITKHANTLGESLKKYHLNDIFDEIIHIKKEDEKHLYIKHKNAIFIDDSFAERRKIHDKCHIPTFDGHMIESLIEKF